MYVTPAGEIADCEAVARCCKGDLDAFAVLVRRHQRAMLNIAYRIAGDYEDASDIVQDAFIAAYRRLSSFRGEAKFSTWLTSITLNQARNHIARDRSRNRRRDTAVDAAAEAPPEVENVRSPAPSPLELLEKQVLSRKVRDCISALPLDYREVLVLRDIEEYSYEEVGAALAIREGTVKSRLFRAREAIKDCLKPILREP